MGSSMRLTDEHLHQIGDYLKKNFDDISGDSSFARLRAHEIQVIERITRVEEELKSQREIIMFGFQQMDKRFETTQKNMDDRFNAMQKQIDERFIQSDKRFEDANKRFDDVNKRFDDVNKRFDDVNKRFDDANKRFDDVNKRFNVLMWTIGLGFTLTTTAMSLLAVFVK